MLSFWLGDGVLVVARNLIAQVCRDFHKATKRIDAGSELGICNRGNTAEPETTLRRVCDYREECVLDVTNRATFKAPSPLLHG